ncbi:MAG: hypothetical protein AAFQ94_18290 [Bacteroidota bacterium]
MKTLAIPVHLDALFLPDFQLVKNSVDDYTKLPYTDGTRDFNPDTPYIGQEIISHPFEDKNLMLNPGIHLHWSLPAGLTKTIDTQIIRKDNLDVLKDFFSDVAAEWSDTKEQIWTEILIASGWIKPINNDKASVLSIGTVNGAAFDSGISQLATQFGWHTDRADQFVAELMTMMSRLIGFYYPGVPNVWMVRRFVGNSVSKNWIVESNFIALSRGENQGNAGAVNIPYHDELPGNKTCSFRYLGRFLDNLTNWSSATPNGTDYLKELTAVGYNPEPGSKGYAEPTFSAFYPNCLSVFGFHDSEVDNIADGTYYEVVGIYSNPDVDFVKVFLKDYENRNSKDNQYYHYLESAFKDELYLQVVPQPDTLNDANLPTQSMLFGRATPKTLQHPDVSKIKLAIGNTGTEALSAFLGNQLEGDKKKIEELFESIQFTSKLHNKVLDIGHKFQEARHEKGFTARNGGYQWNIKIETTDTSAASAEDTTELNLLSIPQDITDLLHDVNKLQYQFDKKKVEVDFLRKQLYSDWYKYMLSSYPPIDAKREYFDNDGLMRYIRQNGIPDLSNAITSLGNASLSLDENGRLLRARSDDGSVGIGRDLVELLNQLVAKVAEFNDEATVDGRLMKEQGKHLAIRQLAASRYWRANDPVVLFVEEQSEGDLPVLLNDRHPTDGAIEVLQCHLFDDPVGKPNGLNATELGQILDTISPLFATTSDATGDKIWNPFMLEWEVEFLPAQPGSNEETNNRKYARNYLSRHSSLKETDPDFSLTANRSIFGNGNLYSGSTILTPNAGTRLDIALSQFLADFGDDQTPDTKQLLEAAKTYLAQINVLSQSIGGFNEALLTQKQTRQLDVADPLGFSGYQDFSSNEVAPLIGKQNLTAPEPLGDFNPIRFGELRVLKLRLVDSFGQSVDFDTPENVAVSETISEQNSPETIFLKPRISQAARLNFRLLSAMSGTREMHSLPGATPICGWLIPNNLDRSIMIYDVDGVAIGALTMNKSTPWLPAPDSSASGFIDSIKNEHLRKVARYLFEKQVDSIREKDTTDNSFLDHFMKALNQADENIDPESFTEHEDLNILIGKPVAIVRGKLGFELETPPAVDNSWLQLSHELLGHGRSSDNFTDVEIPIRLGEYKQLNDGLLGYWLETSDGSLGDNYYSSEAGANPDPFIVTYDEETSVEPMNIYRTLKDDPFLVTMLVDPKGAIHAVTGVLPVKSVTIPKEHYQNSLNKISVTFLTAPVISPAGHLHISLPVEGGYEWSWLERGSDRIWKEIPQIVRIKRQLFDSKFPDQPRLWDQLVAKKWLKVINSSEPLADEGEEMAEITTAVHRAFPPGDDPVHDAFPIAIGRRLDDFFDRYGIRLEPPEEHLSFGNKQVAREGWLKLKKVKS